MITLSEVTSFPRNLSSAKAGERESIEMGPRFRGGDGIRDFHLDGWTPGHVHSE